MVIVCRFYLALHLPRIFHTTEFIVMRIPPDKPLSLSGISLLFHFLFFLCNSLDLQSRQLFNLPSSSTSLFSLKARSVIQYYLIYSPLPHVGKTNTWWSPYPGGGSACYHDPHWLFVGHFQCNNILFINLTSREIYIMGLDRELLDLV